MKLTADELKMFNEEVYEDILDKIEEANLDNRSDFTVEDFNDYGEVEIILDEEEGTVSYTYGISEHGCSMLNLNNINCIANQPPSYAEDRIDDLPEEFLNKLRGDE
jgi:hypothetical protein